ncbi:MAG: ribosome maturation factor RimM [Terricaulis sp.]
MSAPPVIAARSGAPRFASNGSGRPQVAPRPITAPPKPTPAPITPPKPQPELVGESQPVPAFKGSAGSAKSLVLVGAIGGAFGVKGEVRLRAFTAARDGIISYGPLYDEDGKILLRPKSWRELKDGVAVVAPEIKSREQAEEMRGKRLFVPRANLPETAEDEYYWIDLMGCRAEALDGAPLGEVVAVWNFGAGDILEIKPPNGGPHARISFTKENVPLVDSAAKRIVIDPPAPDAVGK